MSLMRRTIYNCDVQHCWSTWQIVYTCLPKKLCYAPEISFVIVQQHSGIMHIFVLGDAPLLLGSLGPQAHSEHYYSKVCIARSSMIFLFGAGETVSDEAITFIPDDPLLPRSGLRIQAAPRSLLGNVVWEWLMYSWYCRFSGGYI